MAQQGRVWDCRWPENCGYQCVASYSLAAILSSFIHCADVHGQLALPVKAQLTASGICQGGAWGAPLGCPCRSSVKRPRGLGSISSSGAGQLCLGTRRPLLCLWRHFTLTVEMELFAPWRGGRSMAQSHYIRIWSSPFVWHGCGGFLENWEALSSLCNNYHDKRHSV